jgi:hypothetical protein
MSQGSKTVIQDPTCIAIVICNEVIEDKRTNNKTLVGLFNQINVPGFPAVHGRLFVMGSFTDGMGECDLSFRLSDPDNNEIVKVNGRLKFEDPLAVRDIVFEMHGVPFKREGSHSVEVWIGDKYRTCRRFQVVKMEGLT